MQLRLKISVKRYFDRLHSLFLCASSLQHYCVSVVPPLCVRAKWYGLAQTMMYCHSLLPLFTVRKQKTQEFGIGIISLQSFKRGYFSVIFKSHHVSYSVSFSLQHRRNFITNNWNLVTAKLVQERVGLPFILVLYVSKEKLGTANIDVDLWLDPGLAEGKRGEEEREGGRNQKLLTLYKITVLKNVIA